MDAVTAEAAVLAEEVLAAPNLFQQLSRGVVLLREMFQEGGPLAALRWTWEEFVPIVERHIYRVMDEVEDMEARRALLFDRCAPELFDRARLDRFEQEFRRVMMAPGRTPEERRTLAMAALVMPQLPREPPYTTQRHGFVSWLMHAQVSEWAERRGRMRDAVWRVVGNDGGSRDAGMGEQAVNQVLENSEELMMTLQEISGTDPEMVDLVEHYEKWLMLSILNGRTPALLYGEEWLWLTVVLREPLRLTPEEAEQVDVMPLLNQIDEEVKQAILLRVGTASQDRSLPAEDQQWFQWAYRFIQVRPMIIYGMFAKAHSAMLHERFKGEAELVSELQRREGWIAEDLEPYRLRLVARDAHSAVQRVLRLQARLRGEASPASSFKM